MSILRDLLVIPDEVKKSDYVVKLSEDVRQPEKLLDHYAVTDEIHAAFDRALTLTGAGLRDRQSVAVFVHGSFGSGKSHFMAILSRMLAGHEEPWRRQDLHDLLAKHGWVKERKLLCIHFHMIGAANLEEKVFGGYLEQVRELHPDAPVPALFEDAPLFENAESVRREIGDDAFFQKLNAAAPATADAAAKGWGKMAGKGMWDAASFAAARESIVRSQREALFSALVRTPFFSAYARASSSYLPFDDGLEVLSRHAQALGYDGVALFLDELILWLMARAGDRPWLNQESQKLAKLFEAQHDRREAPVVSFVARQRDIGEIVGDQFAGEEAHNLRESLAWIEARFETVRLEDRNLPAIVEARVVTPRDGAREKIDAAFTSMRQGLGPAWGTLVGDAGDEAAFRRVYPFSPALVDALVALSHYLQRERTAIKILVELLVDHLNDFELGRLVPVGDLFDVLVGAEEPMEPARREAFRAAKRIYLQELLPIIQETNGTTGADRCQRMRKDHREALGCANCPEARCRYDNRLAKTMLLAALVPEAAVLRALTVSRLVQLNHGTLKTGIPGSESVLALQRIRTWSQQVGKVRPGEGTDPLVTIVLGGVDIKPIIESAEDYNQAGARRRKLHEILFEAMGVETDGSSTTVEHEVEWRGCDRPGIIHFGNVRLMDAATLAAPRDKDFKIVVDYPFDEPPHGPSEDEARVARFMEEAPPTPTVVWIPSFFGEKLQRDLGELVIIERLLEGEWKAKVALLRPEDQERARTELESLASQKKSLLKRVLTAAYGLTMPDEGQLDPSRQVERHFHVLLPGVEIRGVLESVLDRALTSAIDQLLSARFPRHPSFTDRVTDGKLDKCLKRFVELCELPERRLRIDKADAKDLLIAEELGLVTIASGLATYRPGRIEDVDKDLRAKGLDVPTARDVKAAFDPEGAMSLVARIADFLVLAFAAATGREIMRGGVTPADLRPGRIPDDAELVRPPMPSPSDWQQALDAAGLLFGVSIGGRALNARNLRDLAERVTARSRECVKAGAAEIATLLARWSDFLQGEPPRLLTARAVGELCALLDGGAVKERVEALARPPLPTSRDAMARHIQNAAATALCLRDPLVAQNLRSLKEAGGEEAREILLEARQVLEADELLRELAPGLRSLALDAQRLLTKRAPDVPTGAGPELPPARAIVAQGRSGSRATPNDLERDLAKIRKVWSEAGSGAALAYEWRIVREEEESGR